MNAGQLILLHLAVMLTVIAGTLVMGTLVIFCRDRGGGTR